MLTCCVECNLDRRKRIRLMLIFKKEKAVIELIFRHIDKSAECVQATIDSLRAYIADNNSDSAPAARQVNSLESEADALLREIRDRSASEGERRVDSADRLNWHNDRTDIVGLLCVGEAAEGGTSRIASATAIHNEMHRRCPAHLATLYRDYLRYAPDDAVAGTDGRRSPAVDSPASMAT